MIMQRAIFRQLTISAFVLATVGPASAQQFSAVEIVTRAKEAVVVVMSYDREGRALSQGSGFLVGDAGLVTNLHVVEGAYSVTVTSPSGERSKAHGFVAADARADIAILAVTLPNTIGLRLANSDSIHAGEDVTVIGAPLGWAQTVTTGTLSGLIIKGGLEWVQFSAGVSRGSSGGPLLNGAAEVIGVVARKYGRESQLNLAVPSNVVQALLRDSDSILPIAELPSTTRLTMEVAPSLPGPPGGLTGFYRFESLGGYTYQYAWVVENSNGQITGSLFLPHATGFMDVLPIAAGQTPGRRRDFDFDVGCVRFDGWHRDDGTLVGDILNACENDNLRQFRAIQVASDPEKTDPLEGVKLFKLRELGHDLDSAGGWLVVVSPIESGEGSVASMHVWGQLPDGTTRRDLVFPRGRATRRSAEFETIDRFIKLEVREVVGVVSVVLRDQTGERRMRRYEGFRQDLFHCFDVENAEQWRPRLNLVSDRIRAVEDSTAMLGDSIQAIERRVSGRITRSVSVILDPKTQAKLRQELSQVELDLEKLIAIGDRLRSEQNILSHSIENVGLCPGRPSGVVRAWR